MRGRGLAPPRLLSQPPLRPLYAPSAVAPSSRDPGCSFTPEVVVVEVVAAHRAVQPPGCEPWLLKDSCHPELDSGGGGSGGEGGATPSPPGEKVEAHGRRRPHSLLRDGLLLLPQPAEAAAVPVGECGRPRLRLFRPDARRPSVPFAWLTAAVGGGAWTRWPAGLGGRAG